MRIDQLDGLVAFRAVALARSFTAAAAQLEVSTQAISQSIKALEARLGVRLFNRTTRSVSLNEAGERFLQVAGPALAELFDATDALQAFRDKPAGLLRINLPRPAFSGLLQPALAEFHAAYPEIRLEFSFDDGFVDIVALGLDAGIRLGESVAQDMVSVMLSREERIAILASPDYLRRRGEPTTIAELAQHDCIRFRFPGSGAVFRWELLQDGRLLELEVGGPLTVNDTSAMAAAALEGLGLAYVLECTVAEHLASGRLRRVLPQACPSFPGFHLYYPGRRQLPTALRCLIDFWRARLAASTERAGRS